MTTETPRTAPGNTPDKPEPNPNKPAPNPNQPVRPDPQPAARRTDLDTSHAAAESVMGSANLRERLFLVLSNYPKGLTHEQIVTAYEGYTVAQGWPTATPQGIRSRVKELEREGRVRHDEVAQDVTRNNRRTHRWYAITDPDEQAAHAASLVAEAQAKAVAEARDEVFVAPVRVLPAGETVDGPKDLAEDLRAARRAGKFTAPEMAEYLKTLGWKK